MTELQIVRIGILPFGMVNSLPRAARASLRLLAMRRGGPRRVREPTGRTDNSARHRGADRHERRRSPSRDRDMHGFYTGASGILGGIRNHGVATGRPVCLGRGGSCEIHHRATDRILTLAPHGLTVPSNGGRARSSSVG